MFGGLYIHAKATQYMQRHTHTAGKRWKKLNTSPFIFCLAHIEKGEVIKKEVKRSSIITSFFPYICMLCTFKGFYIYIFKLHCVCRHKPKSLYYMFWLKYMCVNERLWLLHFPNIIWAGRECGWSHKRTLWTRIYVHLPR